MSAIGSQRRACRSVKSCLHGAAESERDRLSADGGENVAEQITTTEQQRALKGRSRSIVPQHRAGVNARSSVSSCHARVAPVSRTSLLLRTRRFDAATPELRWRPGHRRAASRPDLRRAPRGRTTVRPQSGALTRVRPAARRSSSRDHLGSGVEWRYGAGVRYLGCFAQLPSCPERCRRRDFAQSNVQSGCTATAVTRGCAAPQRGLRNRLRPPPAATSARRPWSGSIIAQGVNVCDGYGGTTSIQ